MSIEGRRPKDLDTSERSNSVAADGPRQSIYSASASSASSTSSSPRRGSSDPRNTQFWDYFMGPIPQAPRQGHDYASQHVWNSYPPSRRESIFDRIAPGSFGEAPGLSRATFDLEDAQNTSPHDQTFFPGCLAPRRKWLERAAYVLLPVNGLFGFLSLLCGNPKEAHGLPSQIHFLSQAGFYGTTFTYFLILRPRGLGLLRCFLFLLLVTLVSQAVSSVDNVLNIIVFASCLANLAPMRIGIIANFARSIPELYVWATTKPT
ncbi:hypothetical protein BJ508DRAFT_310811 [Ascobolus immersus RN42]|uniref:Uncharacterized protein n=1 Tax=Ascobolus immersus RN42 TaxID=1160509 RepID=A0A3N4HXV0_ASCIM|nr:hypothetical protein BJ508DRAFT_310811 [Ascobolus immersus RN42]